MTKRQLKFWVFAVMSIYLLTVVAGIAIKYQFPSKDDPVYSTFKDLIPFLLAIPTAWLGFCFSRRLSFLAQLRTLWSHLVSAVQIAIQYTHLQQPTQEQYSEALREISMAIDEVRGSFKNVGEAEGKIGLYPFEDLKDIHKIISGLGFGDAFKSGEVAEARTQIGKCWGKVRQPFLSEFERHEPTKPSSRYIRS